jgi:hypothetical protein
MGTGGRLTARAGKSTLLRLLRLVAERGGAVKRGHANGGARAPLDLKGGGHEGV